MNIRNLLDAKVALHLNDGIHSRIILNDGEVEQCLMRDDLLFIEHAQAMRAPGYLITSEELDDRLVLLRR